MSSASPFDGSSGTERSVRAPAMVAPSSFDTMPSIVANCFSVARTRRLLLAAFGRITGGVSVPSSVSKRSTRLRAISAASALRSVSTRTTRSDSRPGATSSCWSISSAASSADGVAEITTALSRSSAITRNAGSAAVAPADAAGRARSARCASPASSSSTSGAICPARAFFRKTVRTRAASRGPRTSIVRTTASTSSSCDGSAATTSELLVGSAETTGRRRFGCEVARAASACSTAFATSGALACDSGYTRISAGRSPSRARSSSSTTFVAIGISSVGAVSTTRAFSASATNFGSTTGAPAFAAATSCAGQRERSSSTAFSADTTTSGATCFSCTTRKSASGVANAF
ncbi:MAG: hypothetical protein LW806_03235 [Planctomycetaceae bacterium]|nr:hypothetical protein [Planctomycetaceae bacterium]